MKALDLFCGAGGAAMGLRRAGFDVTGIDIKPQKNYPFRFIQGDAINPPVNISEFDFVWASPPCQAYSLAHRIRKNDHPDMIAAIREMLDGLNFVIENVPGSPLIAPYELCGAMFGLRTYRHRHFETSFSLSVPSHPKHKVRSVKMGRPVIDGDYMHVVGNFSNAEYARRVMETPWMTRDEMKEAIPPAYSEYIGKTALKHIAG